ncbi:helix-turn-helix domain-containing protein [Amycolatopsis sp. YIM 10]|uniref:helix-turn-helix domain-containing protein n=1 Tax=Amycolatopsis sp. YIM 10 TaxID=2653857 RepID=UPI0012906AF8|nr:helix-turn-helix transcriptional regulator [Amycolatopsis sp. YIM 10]QFU87897.1 hypothetical protein YIM_13555 [Amycolatopsis sp. YIM 10]QFU94790.1 hypothetical protein YIM_48325 [Amycolatopsis sp. YIM 10]
MTVQDQKKPLTFQEELGQALRLARVHANLTVRQVAQRMLPQVTRACVWTWESGAIMIPLPRLRDYARVLGLPVAAIIPPAPWQVVQATRLRRTTITELRPLVEWARGYGEDLIRFSPETVAEAARMCNVTPARLQTTLTRIQLTA